MPTRETNRVIVERRIYDAAIDLFCEQGYDGTTLIDIASEASVSTRTLYRYFPTKESILRRFGRENLMALKIFSDSLPPDMSLHDRIIETMTYDFKQMFCLFDISYILHSARDITGVSGRFELENVLIAESIYYTMIKHEQLKHDIMPNLSTRVAATILVGLYRQNSDIFRFKEVGTFNEDKLREMYITTLDAIWDSLYKTILTQMTEADSPFEHLPAVGI